MKQKNIIKNH